MSIQLRLLFEDVPVTCPTQAKYHAIAPCLAEQIEPRQQARWLNLSYSTFSATARLSEPSAETSPQSLFRNDPHDFESPEEISDRRMV